jgi:hypothetical protein
MSREEVKEVSVHVWNGYVGFKVDDLFFYINSVFHIDGNKNNSSVENSIGIDLNHEQIDSIIGLLNYLKSNLTEAESG